MKRHQASRTSTRVQLLLLSATAMAAAFVGLAATAVSAGTAATGTGEWAFKPSYFSHDPANGQRVAQYAPGEKAYVQINNYRRSGYRQQRIKINGVSGSSDNIHIVETWGDGENIRPYGEWQRPFRAGATPYGPWGNSRGPWTMPFESWGNPYGLGNLRHPPWPHYPNRPGPSPFYGPMPGGGYGGGGYGGGGYGGGGYGGGYGGGGYGGGGYGGGGYGGGGPVPAP